MGPMADMQGHQAGEKSFLHDFDATRRTHQFAETSIIREFLN